LAVLAIVLVSQQSAPAGDAAATSPARASGVGIALASGIAIGLFFLALARTSADAGMWPLVAARSTSFGLFAVLAFVTRRRVRMSRNVASVAIAGGILDMFANVLYLVATRYGPLSTVVTLSSLYPASTVLLARTALGERLNARQVAGIVCALVAVMLIVSSR
jgi:drug/metabolite transporter (DMT)-like permease